MDEKLKMAFGRNLKRLLTERDKTQAELCRRLKVSSATVSDWANGKKIPRADKLQAICVWLNCELSDLLEENPEVLPDGQPTEYYDNEVVQAVTDRLRTNPEYGVLFKASANLKPEDVELVTKFIEKMS
jgi:transcriptional regulator with XRE-family HTH domain